MTVTSPPRSRGASDAELTWQSELFAALPTLAPARGGESTVERLSPRAAFQEVLWGRATLVDIRPEAQRLIEGALPKTLTPLTIEHAALGEHLDPRSRARLPIASTELRVIVICQEGTDSSAAAGMLHDLGVRHAADVVGGFAAWRSLALPVAA